MPRHDHAHPPRHFSFAQSGLGLRLGLALLLVLGIWAAILPLVL